MAEAATRLEPGDTPLSGRIREALAAGGGRAAVAARTGIGERTLGYLLAGQDAKHSQLARIAEATGVRLAWLSAGEGPRVEGGEVAAWPERAAAVVRALPGAARPGVQAVQFDFGWLERVVGRPPESLALVMAVGDAMSPAIRDGDVVMVDRSAIELCSGRLYLVDLGGELQLRRLQRRLTGTLLLICDNERFPPEEVRPSDPPLRIIGEVVWHGRVI